MKNKLKGKGRALGSIAIVLVNVFTIERWYGNLLKQMCVCVSSEKYINHKLLNTKLSLGGYYFQFLFAWILNGRRNNYVCVCMYVCLVI